MSEFVLKNIDPATLKGWMETDDVVVVDIREENEVRRERIEGAHNLPLSRLDVKNVPDLAGKKLVIMCRSGARSARAAEKFSSLTGGAVMHLDGGLMGWKRTGLPSETSPKEPTSIARQVQLAAGAMAIAGTAWLILFRPDSLF